MPILPFTPLAVRHESPHGQGTESYDSVNAYFTETIYPQAAPDPIRQGDTPARPPRQNVAVMSIGQWNYGLDEEFLGERHSHVLTRRMSAGHMNRGHQSPVGIRPNIERPSTQAYGSLFSLGSQTYDIERQ